MLIVIIEQEVLMEKEAVRILGEMLAIMKSFRSENKEHMTPDEVADYLNIEKNTLYQHTRKKEIPFHKRPGGRNLIFVRAEIDAWLQKRGNLETAQEQAKKKADEI
ncbi:helix-turn-helix domain-containing protein [candidate division KSB1 bacterium]|nr:helix-turn-helix domain-containing protein [candidate division KSB1 bacterium]